MHIKLENYYFWKAVIKGYYNFHLVNHQAFYHVTEYDENVFIQNSLLKCGLATLEKYLALSANRKSLSQVRIMCPSIMIRCGPFYQQKFVCFSKSETE